MKSFIHCWHHSKIEEDAVEDAGYNTKQPYETDPFEIAKKIHSCGKVFVAISPEKYSKEHGQFHTIGVSDDWFKQR